jgi:hypothetical protein
VKALLDSTIWDLPTQANMALIWMTRKGSWVRPDCQLLMERNIFTTVSRFAQGGKVHRFASPALVYQSPLLTHCDRTVMGDVLASKG